MTVGERITAARKKKKLRPAEFARRLNVSRQAVHDWEADISRPTYENLRKIALETETPITDLVGSA